MFANCQLMGMDFALPDVCKTPVPTPFPNMAMGSTAMPNAWNILFMAMPAHNMATTIPITLGDQPGALGGVVSQTFMQRSRHVTGSFTVNVKGTSLTKMGDKTMQNRCNSVGIRLLPSQLKVWVLAA